MSSAPWLNSTLATIGQKFAAHNWFAVNSAMIMAILLVGAGQPDIVIANIFESLSHIKTIHLKNIYKHSRKSNRKKNAKTQTYKIGETVWDAFEKDLHNSNILPSRRVIPPGGANYTEYYLNQLAVTSTLWGLSAMPIIRSEQFGISIGSDEELEGYLHFWAFVGHGVGIEDQLNVCLQPNVKEARIYYEIFLNELLVPYLFHLDYERKALVEMTVKGFTEVLGPVAQFDFTLRGMLEDVVGIQAKNLAAKMSPMGRTIDSMHRNVLKPTILISNSAMGLSNMIFYEGYVQNLSKKIFGFDGSNKTVVAQNAFSA